MAQPQKLLLSSLLAVGLVAGCSPGDPIAEQQRDAGDDDSTVTQERYGALAAEVTSSARQTGDVDVQAQFLDARGVDVESALQALEVWAPRRGLETGECRVDGVDDAAGDDGVPVSLHLLDVGDIEVQGPGDEAHLEPRQLPDLLSSFYGVVYGSEWGQSPVETSLNYQPGEPYRFQAPGAGETGAFDVTLQAPRQVVLAAANGQPIDDREAVTLQRGEDLELVWETRGTEEGEVFVDVAVGSIPYGTRVQCRSDDDGALTIPADTLSNFEQSTDLQLRRVHRTTSAVDGLEEVDFYFSTTDDVELRFR